MDLLQAVEVLRGGGVIAYATEAVFGLGCDPQNNRAIERLLQLKQRPEHKGLILIAADEAQLHPYLDMAAISETMWQRVRASWPGPVSWLLPCAASVSRLLRGEHTTLAVRVTAHPQAAALCRAFGGAVVSTSANISQQPPARNAGEVARQLAGRIDGILSGVTGGATNPSEIRDARTGKILRAG